MAKHNRHFFLLTQLLTWQWLIIFRHSHRWVLDNLSHFVSCAATAYDERPSKVRTRLYILFDRARCKMRTRSEEWCELIREHLPLKWYKFVPCLKGNSVIQRYRDYLFRFKNITLCDIFLQTITMDCERPKRTRIVSSRLAGYETSGKQFTDLDLISKHQK